jgi:hypothetical protein
MLSHTGTSFADDMGYKRDGGWYPGVTVFKRLDGQILRIFDPELQSRRRLLQRLAPVRPDAPGRGGPVGEVQIRGRRYDGHDRARFPTQPEEILAATDC